MRELDSFLSYTWFDLGRHSDKKVELNVHCVMLNPSVVHMFWECSTLIALVVMIYVEFKRLSMAEKRSYVFSSENWEDNFHVCKKNYTVMTYTQVTFSFSHWPGIWVLLLELGVALLSQLDLVSHVVRVRVRAMLMEVHVCMLACNGHGSTHSSGCMVNAFEYCYYTVTFLATHASIM